MKWYVSMTAQFSYFCSDVSCFGASFRLFRFVKPQKRPNGWKWLALWLTVMLAWVTIRVLLTASPDSSTSRSKSLVASPSALPSSEAWRSASTA